MNADNAMVPPLGQDPESNWVLRRRLAALLSDHHGETVIADWPQDLANLLIVSPLAHAGD